MLRHLAVLYFGLMLCLIFSGGISSCGDDDDESSGGDSDSDTDADTDSDSDSDTDSNGDGSALGDTCRVNEDCTSGYCESYWTAPPDSDAFCDDPLPQGEIRILGNTRNFETMEIMPGLNVDVIGGPSALQDPEGALALDSAVSDKDGIFAINAGEVVTKEPMAIGARVRLDGFFLSLTGLSEPEIGGTIYPPGVRNHDVWAVPQSMVDEWSSLLQSDPILKNFAPLGVNGGAFGRVRDADTGQPPAEPVVLKSRHPESQAFIRYLNDDGTAFVEGQSGTSGLYLILNASLAEKFDAYRNDQLISIHECTIGSGYDAVGTTSIQVDEDYQ